MRKARFGRSRYFNTKKQKKSWRLRGIRSGESGRWNLPGMKETGNDYRSCSLSVTQWIRYSLEGLVFDLAVAWLFYRSERVIFLFLPAVLLVPLTMKKRLAVRKREQLASQFKDGVLSAAAAISAGYSVENAWKEAAGEMESLYGADSVIAQELHTLCRKLSSGQTSERAVQDLADRSGVPEI